MQFNYVETPQHLLCAVCSQPANAPVITQCGFLCCRSCNDSSQSCRLCAGPNNVAAAPKFLIDSLDKLPVSCSYCQETVKRGDFLVHLGSCTGRRPWGNDLSSLADLDIVTSSELESALTVLSTKLTTHIDSKFEKVDLLLDRINEIQEMIESSKSSEITSSSELPVLLDPIYQSIDPSPSLSDVTFYVSIADERPLVPMTMNLNESVSLLKETIKDHVSTDLFDLVFRSQLMDESKCLFEVGIEHDCVVFVNQYVTVNVTMSERDDTYQISVVNTGTVADLKNNLMLTLLNEVNSQLSDDFSIYQSFNDELIELRDHELIANLDLSESFLSVGQQSTSSFPINVRFNNGKASIFYVKDDDFVEDLKEEIAKVFTEFSDIDRHLLIFNGKVLENSKTLGEYSISSGLTVHFSLKTAHKARSKRSLRVVIVDSSETINVDVSSVKTVSELKSKLQEVTGIPIESQGFVSKGKKLSNHDSIKPNIELFLVQSNPVLVRSVLLSGKELVFALNNGTTIAEIKELIGKSESLLPCNLIVCFNQTVLNNNEKLSSLELNEVIFEIKFKRVFEF
ncbi:hypothetical protein RCL1_006724 [Eukaryota sp. TZLM3-RCL]